MNSIIYLETETILQAIDPNYVELASIYLFPELSSTNDFFKKLKDSDLRSGLICLAEHQVAGRGRQGKTWHSPAATNIYASFFWRFPSEVPLHGLSLVVSMAILNALQSLYPLPHLSIKWPNDLLWQGKKLAGTLIELSMQKGHQMTVIGIGLNVNMQDDVECISQPWTALQAILGFELDRNRIVSTLINHLFKALFQFAALGFTPFLANWQNYDYLKNKPITLLQREESIRGVARGINQNGELLLQRDNGIVENFSSGETSVRVINKD